MNFTNEHAFNVMDEPVKKFGELFTNYVMNSTKEEIDSYISGKCTAPDAIKLREELNSFNPAQIETLKKFIFETITSCMFNTMIMINENDDIHLTVEHNDENIEIKEVSDGLEGDMWFWIDWWGNLQE